MGQLDNQIGFADESTYGTRVAPTQFNEFISEAIKRQQTNRQSAGLRKGSTVQRQDRQSQALKGASGPVVLDLTFEGVSKLLKHMMGAASTIVAFAPAQQHTYVPGDGVGLSLTTQVGRPGTAGTVQPFDYTGCKVADWTITQSLDAYAQLSMTIDAQSEDDTQTLATPSYPATQTGIHDGLLSITVNGTPFFSRQSSLTYNRNLNLTRFFERASTLKKEPLRQGLFPITGDLQGEFEDLTTFNLFKNGTIVPIVYDWVGVALGAKTYELKITLPACRLEGPMPETKAAGVLDADTPFSVLNDGVDAPITVMLMTTDTTD